MQNIIFSIFLLFLCSCSVLQMVGLGEDIVDDAVKLETGTELNIGPQHAKK